ncbi:hypothetical protein BD413DRAFT_527737 [Trametes elegans]|nr:hypothetical protein BD413DRAFT_527737 [Trametes elegans]
MPTSPRFHTPEPTACVAVRGSTVPPSGRSRAREKRPTRHTSASSQSVFRHRC